jgi:hypothetical protein
MSNELSDICADCEVELEDEVPGEERKPCPNCGSTARTHRRSFAVRAPMRASVEAQVIRAWDSNSLTLAGVIYGIVVTVVGVMVAPHGTAPTVIYAVIALAGLAAGLLLFAQAVIGWMRWLLKRGTP